MGFLPVEHLFHLPSDWMRIYQLSRKPMGLLGMHQFWNPRKPLKPNERDDNRNIGGTSLPRYLFYSSTESEPMVVSGFI